MEKATLHTSVIVINRTYESTRPTLNICSPTDTATIAHIMDENLQTQQLVTSSSAVTTDSISISWNTSTSVNVSFHFPITKINDAQQKSNCIAPQHESDEQKAAAPKFKECKRNMRYFPLISINATCHNGYNILRNDPKSSSLDNYQILGKWHVYRNF